MVELNGMSRPTRKGPTVMSIENIYIQFLFSWYSNLVLPIKDSHRMGTSMFISHEKRPSLRKV